MAATKSTIVLCEDEAHALFVYRWLLNRGLKSGEIRIVPCPAGRGAGTQHVVTSYPGEVSEYRARANHVSSRRLIVVIDADTSTVPQRLASLEAKLRDAGLAARASTERICLLVPRRNVETWIHFLQEKPVNETDDYSAFYLGDDRAPACENAGRAFNEWLQSAQPPDGSPPSLVAARQEAVRL